MIGTFRSTDSNAKELFVNHPVGHGMDGVILRDKDANSAWATAMDGAREDRTYYCQNWRGDVVMLLNSDATLKETVRYSAYGVPFGIPFGDVDGDGDVDAGDSDQLIEWESSHGYTPRGDLDLDGDIDFTDTAIQGGASGVLGRGELSLIGNRKGYAGYEHDGVFSAVCHVRHRVLLTELGRWTRRDPLGYVDGMSVYEYAKSSAIAFTDTSGLSCQLNLGAANPRLGYPTKTSPISAFGGPVVGPPCEVDSPCRAGGLASAELQTHVARLNCRGTNQTPPVSHDVEDLLNYFFVHMQGANAFCDAILSSVGGGPLTCGQGCYCQQEGDPYMFSVTQNLTGSVPIPGTRCTFQYDLTITCVALLKNGRCKQQVTP